MNGLLDSIIKRLIDLGCDIKEYDFNIVIYFSSKIEQEILNETNQITLPIELSYVVVERVVGEVLKFNKQSKLFTEEEIEGIVSSLSMGDTSVSYDTNLSTEARFDSMVSELIHYGNEQIIRFRQIVW